MLIHKLTVSSKVGKVMNTIMLKNHSLVAKTKNLAIFLVIGLLLAGSLPLSVNADRFDDEIKAIQQEVDGFQSQASQLSAQANTLQNRLNVLAANKAALQAQINLKQAEYDRLTNRIQETQAKLDAQKAALASSLQDAYIQSSVTPLEMVASSHSIGDYIDKQEYSNIIREQVQSSIKEIRALKDQLTAQQKDVEHVLADQKAQRERLAAQEAEQANLLIETQGQEAAYQNLVSQKSSQIAQLRAEQAAANSRLGGRAVAGDPHKGGYPDKYANAGGGGWTMEGCWPDEWGMCARQCVSYTAWKVRQKNGYMPNWGNRNGDAKYWPDNARADGIPTGSTPRAHSVAISRNGSWGHAMWVEVVNSDGTLYVSQYNYGLNGQYSEMTVSSAGLTFIYF